MHRIITLFLTISLISYQCKAQSDIDNSEKSFIFKLAPFKLMGPEMNFSSSLERKFNQHFSTQIQADYIFSVWNTGDSSVRQNFKASGYRIIPEVRYYYGDYDMTMGYMGVNLLYKHLNTTYKEFRAKTDGAGQTFLQLTEIELKKNVLAPHLILGWLFYLEKQKRISIDLNAGVGFRSRRVTSSLPLINDGRFTINTNTNTETFSMICNLKLGYSFYR